MKDIPIFGSFLKFLTTILTYNEIEDEIAKLRSENTKLHSSITKLTNVTNSLRQEINNFSKLQSNLELFAAKQEKDFNVVLTNLNNNFDRINKLLNENEKVLLMKVAQDVEFLDHNEGMTKSEYNRFVQRIPFRLENKFRQLDSAKKLDKYFQLYPNATIQPKTIQSLIDELCQSQ